MDYLDLEDERSYEDLVSEAMFKYDLKREAEQLKYLEEKEKENGV